MTTIFLKMGQLRHSGQRPSLLCKITIPDGHYSREQMQTILNQHVSSYRLDFTFLAPKALRSFN